jgi:transcriptional regulator
MTTIACGLFFMLPLLLLGWLTESSQQRAQRLKRSGWSQRRIAEHLGLSRYRVRLLLN